MEIIIEEISRGKKIIGRHKFSTRHVEIGRGYNNDIILSDPHICAQHLSLTLEEGLWYIEDLRSLNGSQLGSRKALLTRQAIHSGDVVTIGKTQLRFMLPNHPVATSIKFNAIENIVEHLGRWPVMVAMLTLFTALNIMMMYLNTATKEVNYNTLALWGLMMTLGYAIWPLLCSLMSHLNKHETRVGTQIGVSFLMINLFWLIDFIEAFLGFNLSSNWSINWMLMGLSFCLVFSMLWLNLFIAFQQTQQRRVRVSLAITTLIFAGSFLYNLSNKPDFKTYPVYNSNIMSPAFSVSPPTLATDFVENSNELFEVTSKEANKNQE